MAKRFFIFTFAMVLSYLSILAREEGKETKIINFSEETEACMECHNIYNPGIVEDWLMSRHSKNTPETASKRPPLERRISSKDVPKKIQKIAVGCYECHSLNGSNHKDHFDHFGFKINIIVSPHDCKMCHTLEVNQFMDSKKAHALNNLKENSIYNALVETITCVKEVKDGKVIHRTASENTRSETCFACHGTKVLVNGTKKIATELGEIEIPNLVNWPNQGVGRMNPDGSHGACTACHPRHSFSIEIARKPYTCSQCHLEPDLPAWNVYKESKHGNILLSKNHKYNWDHIPWVVGKDFRAPTCSTCHNSLLVNTDYEEIISRTHNFGDRLWIRIFGLIYSHPQPKSGKTYLIKNKEGLPLPTTFSGELASEYLINREEQMKHQTNMKRVCQSCHNTDWINQRFARLDSSIKETDEMTFAATQLLLKAWDIGMEDQSNPFDETIEQKWILQWLFYANSVRYGTAMMGPDYSTFKNGWWELTKNLQSMKDSLQSKAKIRE